MHGVFIEKGLSDWQIIQHCQGKAQITLSGSWIVPKDAIKQGVRMAEPMIRVLSEEDNTQIIPWQMAESKADDPQGYRGTWNATLTVPAGGLYRIETGLKTTAVRPGLVWVFRGDTRFHFGVGDVFLIGGQSNAAGYGKDTAYDPPELGVHIYRNRRSWDLASHPLNESTYNADAENAEMGVSGSSPYLAFGKQFRKLSHYPVGLIATAKGGMPMKKWEPGRGGLYRNMLEQAKACGPIAGVLWYQGCSDTDHKASEFKERYYTMIEQFRKDLGYPVKFFTFQLNRQITGEDDHAWGVVREAQRTAAHDLPDVYILPTINGGLSDAIHNSCHTCVLLGERLARQCGHVLYGTPAYFAPEITDAVQEDGRLRLRFAHVNSGFIITGDSQKDCGFTLMDQDQNVLPFQGISTDPSDPASILIALKEPLPTGATVSFGWQANPVAFPLMDEETYLPPLSFYQYPIA